MPRQRGALATDSRPLGYLDASSKAERVAIRGVNDTKEVGHLPRTGPGAGAVAADGGPGRLTAVQADSPGKDAVAGVADLLKRWRRARILAANVQSHVHDDQPELRRCTSERGRRASRPVGRVLSPRVSWPATMGQYLL